jgi:hypothetical protein
MPSRAGQDATKARSAGHLTTAYAIGSGGEPAQDASDLRSQLRRCADVLVEQLRRDSAIAEADTLLLTVPNQLGVAYNAHVIDAILSHVAPALSWR